jgi:hypothetical protein
VKKVYKVNWDFEHSGDMERDAFHISFPDDDKIMYFFSSPEMYSEDLLPKEILFQANFNLIPNYDYPLTDLQIPILSVRMLNTLEEIRCFDYYAVPVIMIDDTYMEERFNEDGNLNIKVPTNKDYVAVRLSNLLDSFDYENSDFRALRSNPKAPGRIKKLVLKEPKLGFPPMFRVNVISSTLFVSEEAKIALEQNKIKGCVFEEVEITPFNQEA